MTEILGVPVSEYRWKPYPSKTYEEEQAFSITKEEMYSVPEGKRKVLNETRSNYVGRLISHRGENKSNYEFLKEQPEAEDINVILADHVKKERNIDQIHHNEAFKSLRYV